MNFIEFLGFIFSFAAMLYMFIRRTREDRRRRENPKEYEREIKERDEVLKKYFKDLSVDIDDEDNFSPPTAPIQRRPFVEEEEEENEFLPPLSSQPKPVPKPHTQRIVNDQFAIKTAIESRSLKTAVEQKNFKTAIEQRYQKPYAHYVESPDMTEANNKDAYAITSTSDSSKIRNLVLSQSNLKNAVLLAEVLKPPLGLR